MYYAPPRFTPKKFKKVLSVVFELFIGIYIQLFRNMVIDFPCDSLTAMSQALLDDFSLNPSLLQV